jgi:hypothetical protein
LTTAKRNDSRRILGFRWIAIESGLMETQSIQEKNAREEERKPVSIAP